MTTLREQAAIAAMLEMVCKLGPGVYHPEDLAIDAVKCADALLAELARTAPTPAADATRLTCTAAERDLIEAMVRWDGAGWGANGFELREDFYIAHYKVLDERRAAKEAKT